MDGPASGEKGSKGRNWLECIRGKGARKTHQGACELPWNANTRVHGGWEIALRRDTSTHPAPLPLFTGPDH